MKDIIQFSFDFFAYVIPGLFVIFSISLITVPIDSIDIAIEKTKDFTTEIVTVVIIVSYVIGFIIYPIGRLIYKTFGFKLFPKLLVDKKNDESLSLNAKYSLLRELSPTNFKYVESWNIYCAMAHNLMVASLVFTFVSLIKFIISKFVFFWLGAVLLGIFIFLVLTHRAVTYSQWAKGDINASIESLNLDNKTLNN